MERMNWIVMSIPGDDERGEPTSWFAYNRKTRKSVRADDYEDAQYIVTELNGPKA